MSSAVRSPPVAAPRTARAAWIAWGLAASCYLLAMFHRMTLGVASLDAGERLGVGAGMIAAISVVGIASYVVGQVPAGLLADRIGPRRALVVGLLLMTAGEAAFALSTSAVPAIGGRALIGFGDACIFLNVLRVVAHWFPRSMYAPLTSATAALGAVGQLATTVPLSHALEDEGWSATFLAGAGVTLLFAIAVGTRLRERPDGELAPARGSHPPIRAGLARAWRRPQTREGFWLHFTALAPFVVVTGLWGAPILVDAQDMSRANASAMLLFAVAVTVVAAPLLGLHARRHPAGRLALGRAISAGVVAALAVLTIVPANAIPLALTLLSFAVLGLGCSASVIAFDLARREGDQHDGASTSALVNLGGFSAAILGDATVAVARGVLGVGSGAVLLPVLLIATLGLWRLSARTAEPVAAAVAV